MNKSYNQSNYNTLLANCYLEYDIILEKYYIDTIILTTIVVNISKDELKFICKLGDRIIDHNARMIMQGSVITFNSRDFKNLVKISNSTYRSEKEGFIVDLIKQENSSDYLVKSVKFYVKISPEK